MSLYIPNADGATASTYIRARLVVDVSNSTSSSTVTATLQVRRTNSYGGQTYQYGPSSRYTIGIDGTNTELWQNAGSHVVIPAYNTSWINVGTASKTISHTDARNITVAFASTDMGSYLSASASGTVSLPQLSSAPSGGSAKLVSRAWNKVVASASISSFGIPSSNGGRYSEVGILPASATGYMERYTYQATSNSNSTGDKTFTHANLIGCAGFKVGWYANNTAVEAHGINGTTYYLPPHPLTTLSVASKTKTSITEETIKLKIVGAGADGKNNVSGAKVYVDYRYKFGASGSWSGWINCASNVSPDSTVQPTFKAPYDTTVYVEARQRRYSTGEASETKSINFATDSTYYLDLNESLDGTNRSSSLHFTADVTVGGTTVATGVDDFNKAYPSGFAYSIKVTAKSGYILYKNGSYASSFTYTGTTTTSATDVRPQVYTCNAPKFTNFTYADTNSTTAGITGDDQYLIQKHSVLTAYVTTDDKMTAISPATARNYAFSFGNTSKTANYSASATVSASMGNPEASGNPVCTVTAFDNLGSSTLVSKTIPVIPYTSPELQLKVERLNDYEDQTTLKTTGTYSTINVNGEAKNAIQNVQYRYKKTTDSTWGNWGNLNFSYDDGEINVTDTVFALDNEYEWDIQVRVIDKLETSTAQISVSKGIPIIKINDNGAIGINCIPGGLPGLYIEGKLYLNGVEITTS